MKATLLLSAAETDLGAAVLDAARGGAADAWLMVPGATDGLPHTLALGGDARSFDAVLDVSGATLEDLLARLDALRPLVALAGQRSPVLAGTEHVIAPGDAPFQFLVVLALGVSLSREAFQPVLAGTALACGSTRWRRARLPAGPRRSRSESAGRRASRPLTLGFEGTASGYVPDLATFHSALGDAARLAPILDDERRFIDHSRTSVGVYAKVPAQ
jgi:hypothetical protein